MALADKSSLVNADYGKREADCCNQFIYYVCEDQERRNQWRVVAVCTTYTITNWTLEKKMKRKRKTTPNKECNPTGVH